MWNGITCAALQVGGNETESSLQEKELWTTSQRYALAARKASHILSYISKKEVRKSMEGISSSTQHLRAHVWSTLSSFDLSSMRQTRKDWNESPGRSP